MRTLTAAQMLEAWEQGLSEPAGRRVLPLLAAALSDASIETLATLSIGERDRWLIILRSSIFGSQLASMIGCSACGEQLEWTIDSSDLFPAKQTELPGELLLEADHYNVSFRLPNSLDLVAIDGSSDAQTARWSLLRRCISVLRKEGQEISPNDMPAPVADAVAKRMGEADPLANIQVELACPACGHNWHALFDIESFFWSEINAWAQRILSEVHRLAGAYGWCEKDILNLSPWRRQFYLGLVGG